MAIQFYQRNWNSGVATIAVRSGPTEFDLTVQRLGLKEYQYPGSLALLIWVKKHRNYKYVPEWLLHCWGIRVLIDRDGE